MEMNEWPLSNFLCDLNDVKFGDYVTTRQSESYGLGNLLTNVFLYDKRMNKDF